MKDTDKKFPGQICQNETTNSLFRDFHERLVNEIISFCKLNKIVVDEFILKADGLSESIKNASWQPCTDSYFGLYEGDMRFDEEPYLMSL